MMRCKNGRCDARIYRVTLELIGAGGVARFSGREDNVDRLVIDRCSDACLYVTETFSDLLVCLSVWQWNQQPQLVMI